MKNAIQFIRRTLPAPLAACASCAVLAAPLPPLMDDQPIIFQTHGDAAHEEILIAQTGHPPMPPGMPGGPGMPDIHAIVNDAMSGALAQSMHFGAGRNVRNAPYSAEAITEKTLMLADGNQIARKTTSRVFRNSLGETRQEVIAANSEIKSIHIRDAAGNGYLLTPAKKSAIRLPGPALMAGPHAGEARKIVIAKHGGEAEGVTEKSGPAGTQEIRKEVRIRVMEPPDGGMQHLAAMSDAFADVWHMGDPMGSGSEAGYESTTTGLGSRDLDGVRAEGKRTARTIPAGVIGNKNPITVTSETWFSTELGIVVYSKRSDPRTGDTVYRLANLKRADPPAELFKVPSDYSVKDPMANMKPKTKTERN